MNCLLVPCARFVACMLTLQFLVGCDRPAPQAPAVPATAPAPAPAVAPAAAIPPVATPAAPSATPTVAAAQAPESDSLPPITVEPPVLDFGVMAPRAGGKGSVRLTNSSASPLRIVAVTPSCKCTATNSLAGTVIAPGASETLEAVLDGAAMPQTHRASIKVAVEGFSRVVEVQLRGETSMPIRAVPTIINAVEGKPRAGRVLVESVDKRPFTVCAVGGRVPEFIGFAPGDGPRSQYLLKYDLDAWGGSFPAYLAIETDREDCPVFDVWIRTAATIPKSVLRMKDYRVNVGRIDLGGSKDVMLDMEDPGEDIIAAQSESPEVQLEMLGQEVRDGIRSVRLRVTPKRPTTGLLYAKVHLFARERDQLLTLFASVRAAGAEGCVGCDPVAGPPAADPAADTLRDLSAPQGR